MFRFSVLMFCFAALGWNAAESQTLQPLAVNGPTSATINIVITADGLTQEEIDAGKFKKKAEWLAQKIVIYSPFSEYPINFFWLPVVSKDSGINRPGVNKNTFFALRYYNPPNRGEETVGMTENGIKRANQLINDIFPECDALVIVANDTAAGNSASGQESTNSVLHNINMVAVTGDTTRNDLADVAMHELGHLFGRLLDEYLLSYKEVEIPSWAPNVTGDLNHIPWRVAWIKPDTPVPIKWGTWPDNETVSAFTKAHAPNGYSPQQNCRMRSAGYPKFCKICKEAMILGFYRRLYPIQNWSPRSLDVTLFGGETQTFRVETIKPKTHNLIVRAAVDGVELLISGNSITLSGTQLGNGVHQILLTAIDTTSAVRNDPEKMLTDQKTWTVTVSGAGPNGVLPYSIAADFNGDGQVEFKDFFTFVDVFNKSKGEEGFDPRINLNRDRRIDFEDFFLFAFSFGKRGLAPSGRELFSVFYRDGYESVVPPPDRSKKPAGD